MDKQPKGKSQPDQPAPWSAAELKRVSRVFDLLIRIDQRKKTGSQSDSKRSTDNTR